MKTIPAAILLSLSLGCAGHPRARRSDPAALHVMADVAPTPVVDASATPVVAARPLTDQQVCRRGVSAVITEALTSQPATAVIEHACPESNPMCDTVDRAPRGADRCFVSNDHIARDERSIAREPAGRASSVSAPWNRARPPQFMDLVDRHVHLSDHERALLRRNGFVGLERLTYDSYALALHEVFRQQLPVFIGVDAILHAIFVAHGAILKRVEHQRLHRSLRVLLDGLRAELRTNRLQLARETQLDLDVYLTVAARLLAQDGEAEPRSLFAQDDSVDAIVHRRGLERVSLFGRERVVDFGQLSPRGHYTEAVDAAGGGTLEGYFRAMQWLSRVEFNLVSRGCRSSAPELDRSETPREALAAVALARLVERAGMSARLAEFERVYAVFAGRREDVPLPALAQLAERASMRDASGHSRLVAAIGQGYRRTARLHFTPENAGELPVIATMFGPRIVPDTAPLTALVHDAVPDRDELTAADVGYLLGHRERAAVHNAAALQRHRTLRAQLDRGAAALADSVAGRRDLYARWLEATLTLAAPREGAWPSFARTEAYGDYRLNAALVTYGQIRHNYVLMAGQGYDSYGCEIPDGYVEPAVETWEALQGFVRAAREVDPASRRFFDRVDGVLETLRTISIRERTGAPLTEAQRRWLSMVSEFTRTGGSAGMSGQPPKWTGWYFDLFADREIGAERAADFIADYFTLSNAGRVRYLGARTPMLGVFVVDSNGPARVMVGPIARGYERSEPIANERLTDESAREIAGGTSRWRDSYSAPAPVEEGETRVVLCDSGELRVLRASGSRGAVEASLLDHHGEVMTDVARARVSPTAPAVLEFARAALRGAEGVHVRIGEGESRVDRVFSIPRSRFGAVDE